MSYWHYIHQSFSASDNTLLISLFSVIVGFGLAAVWDVWKRRRDRKEELARACRSILQETEVNFRALKSGITLLTQDNQAADNSREVVNQVDRLSLAAGESAYLKGSLEDSSPDLAIRLRDIYAGLGSINHKIEGRDLYRATNGAMSNYHQRRKMINDELLTLMSSLETQLNEFNPKIEKLLSTQ